jgi:hypothetical protein
VTECSCSAQRIAAFRDKLARARLDLVVTRPPPARRRPFRKSPSDAMRQITPPVAFSKVFVPFKRVSGG